MALCIVSLAALTTPDWRSSVNKFCIARYRGSVAMGAVKPNNPLLGTSGRVLSLVENKFVPAVEIIIGNVAVPLRIPVLSASRPPHPVSGFSVVLAMIAD